MSERPSLYFHFEMGVSWPRDSRHHRNHQMTIMSRSARDRARQLPSSIPPPDPAYATDVADRRYRVDPHQSNRLGQHEAIMRTYPNHAVEQLPSSQMHPSEPFPHAHVARRRSRRSRSQSRSSHERGHSAPPPNQGNPWDLEPEPMTATAMPRREQPQVWKALPPTPAQFRLGHDDMPWSPSPFPTSSSPGVEGASGTNSEDPGYQNPSSHGSPYVADDFDRARSREMQSLATAMMTVDNGFEDQWWYQGPRLVNIAGELFQAANLPEAHPSDGRFSWPIATRAGPSGFNNEFDIQQQAPPSSMVDMVSPVSDLSSPGSRYALKRSLTTRSEELHL